MAQELSKDPFTAKKGGLIGPYQQGMIDKAFDDAVTGTDVGKLGGPFQGSDGWHIIKVEAVPTFEQAHDELVDQARKAIQAQNWITLSEEIEHDAGIDLDTRFGRWKGMAFGGITPAFEVRLQQNQGQARQQAAPSERAAGSS